MAARRAAIRVLPETTANRIAAGEVVERPAAVVKELVENALDAGATRIAVTLEGGGSARLLVEDDGCGMPPADLALCALRHATSKLPEEGTLFRIATLGFRGEALPSIGAVARLSITSRPPGAAAASCVRVTGGRLEGPMPAAGPPGTRVEVCDLFYATPARRAFLRGPRTEAAAALEAVRALALAWPAVGFTVTIDGRTALALAPAERGARLRDLLGAGFAAAARPVVAVAAGLTLDGLAADARHSRPNTLEQHLVVNRRPVRDAVLRAALRVAYREVLPPGRHPAAALFLELPPEAVDVNVHPAKTELRFRDEPAVRGLLIGALRRALGVGAGDAGSGAAEDAAAVARSGVPAGSPVGVGWAGRGAAWPGRAGRPGLAEAQAALHGPALLASPSLAGPRPAALPLGFAATAPEGMPEGADSLPEGPLGRPIAQLADTYILALAADGGLILVDQHAAHERLTHEALRAALVAGEVAAQPLLIPAVVELPAPAATRLLAHAALLARLGLELEGFGPGAVLVRALPALLGRPDPAPLLEDLAAELPAEPAGGAQHGGASPGAASADAGTDDALAAAPALVAALDAALARLACHGSIRAGRRLAATEMAALLRAMEATPRADTCSHGRPTWLRLGPEQLARMFGRR